MENIEITDLICGAITNSLESPDMGVDHFRRPTGSYLAGLSRSDGQRSADLLAGLADQGKFADVTEQARGVGSAFGACRYFRGEVPKGFRGVENVALVGDLSFDKLKDIKVVQGQHGLELVCPSVFSLHTDALHVIVGDPKNPDAEPELETAVIYTWYPGRLTPKVDIPSAASEFSPAELRRLLPSATVKLGFDAIELLEKQ